MDDLHLRFVVVGAGPAGCSATKTLIEMNSVNDVLLIGREATLAYERPPLSKQALLEAYSQPSLTSDALWLIEHEAHCLLNTTVIEVNAQAHYVLTANHQKIYYEKLLLTVGADAKKMQIEGEDLQGVLSIRDFQDAEKLKPYLQPQHKLVVIGQGFIGLEVAATAKKLGMDVTVIGLSDRIMSRTMPREVSDAFEKKFQQEGVKLLYRQSVAKLQANAAQSHVNAVLLENGDILEADVVVIGIGAQPNNLPIQGISHLFQNGIAVNSDGQTRDPDIFAAGDVANRLTHFIDEQFHLRIEAWEPAREQGEMVARYMSEQQTTPVHLPWMWSDQFDYNLQAIGYGHLATQQVVLGDITQGKFTLLQCKDDGQLVGAITVNQGKDMMLCKRALKNHVCLDLDEIRAHDTLPLKQILAFAKTS